MKKIPDHENIQKEKCRIPVRNTFVFGTASIWRAAFPDG